MSRLLFAGKIKTRAKSAQNFSSKSKFYVFKIKIQKCPLKISHSDVPDAPWYTLVHSSTLWYTLVHLSTLWYTLVRLSTLWYNLVHLNILWYTLVHLSILWYTLAQSGRLWYRLVHCVILWYTLVHCVTLCYMLVLLIINLLLYNPPYIVSVLVDWMYAP